MQCGASVGRGWVGESLRSLAVRLANFMGECAGCPDATTAASRCQMDGRDGWMEPGKPRLE